MAEARPAAQRQWSRASSVSGGAPALESKFKYHAFIMYASDDCSFAQDLHEDLQDIGFNVAIHDKDFIPGQSVIGNIQHVMEKSRKLVFIHSPSSDASAWCQYEQTLAEHDEVDRGSIRSVFVVKDMNPNEERIKMHTYIKADHPHFFELLCDAVVADDVPLIEKFPCGNIAMGLAWNYFYGYLRLILPGLPDRIRQSKWYDEDPSKRRICCKMIIFVPQSCLCPDHLKEAHARFGDSPGNLEPFRATRCGNIHRSYKNTIQVVKTKEGEEYYFVGEFPPPISTMYEMEHSETTALDEVHKHKQVNMFYYQVKNILSHRSNKDCQNRFHLMYYNDENPEERESLPDKTIEFIKGTIKEELKRERHQMYRNSAKAKASRNEVQNLPVFDDLCLHQDRIGSNNHHTTPLEDHHITLEELNAQLHTLASSNAAVLKSNEELLAANSLLLDEVKWLHRVIRKLEDAIDKYESQMECISEAVSSSCSIPSGTAAPTEVLSESLSKSLSSAAVCDASKCDASFSHLTSLQHLPTPAGGSLQSSFRQQNSSPTLAPSEPVFGASKSDTTTNVKKPACAVQLATASSSIPMPAVRLEPPKLGFLSITQPGCSPVAASISGVPAHTTLVASTSAAAPILNIAPISRGITTMSTRGSAGKTDGIDKAVNKYEPGAFFKPIVLLPDPVEVRMGEEDNLFCQRAHLYQHDPGMKQWKHYDVGEIMILKNPKTGKCRMQVLKLCASHPITPEMFLKPMAKSKKAFHWIVQNYSEEEMKTEELWIRFNTADLAENFKKVFEDCQKYVQKQPSTPTKSVANVPTSTTDGKKGGFGDRFKPKSGEWECQGCYVVSVDQCPACGTARPEATAAAASVSDSAKPTSTKPIATSTIGDFGDKFKPKSGDWECSGCYINNAESVKQCPACNTMQSGGEPEHSNKISSLTTKGSGFGQFTFGTPYSVDSKPTGGFNFGTLSQVSTAPTFGSPGKAETVKPKADAKSVITSTPKVHSNKISSLTTKGSGVGTFTFGALVASSFAFGTPKSVDSKSTGGFNFGTPSQASPASTFGSPAKTETVATAAAASVSDSAKPTSTKPIATSAIGDFSEKFKPESGDWECSGCYIKNAESVKQCPACNTMQSGGEPVHSNKISSLTTKGSGFGQFTFGTPYSVDSKPTGGFNFGTLSQVSTAPTFGSPAKTEAVRPKADAKSVITSTPKVHSNKISSLTTKGSGVGTFTFGALVASSFAFGTPKSVDSKSTGGFNFGTPSQASTASTFGSPAKTETVATAAAASVSDSAKPTSTKPIATSAIGDFSDKFRPESGDWECSGCYIKNAESVKQCPACNTMQSGGEPVHSNKISSLTTKGSGFGQFTFGTPYSVDSKPTGGFNFGTLSQVSTAPTFGSPAKTETVRPKADAKSVITSTPKVHSNKISSLTTKGSGVGTFTFGALMASSFDFGAPKSVDSKPTSGFNFGTPSQASTASTFGSPAKTETVKPKADAKSVITSTPKVFVPQLTGFTFGMASSTFNFTPNKPADKPMNLSPQSPGVNGYYSIKDIILKPLIHLEKVEVKTGEEDETIVYSHHAKLFRFVNSEWKERGTGDVKILEHNITHKFRFIMRREQILKLCLNHAITSDLELKVMINAQGKAWVWMAEDFSEGEGSQEVFAVKFRSKEIADEFKAAFDRVKENASKSPDTSRDMTTNEAEDNGVAVKEGKPEVSSSMLNFSLEAEDTKSKSPETVKPKADAKSVITSTPKVFVPQLTGFSFGMTSSTFNFTPNKPADKPMDLSPQSPIQDIIFKPLIHLEKVEVKTGEEDETIVYSQRAKLFRFVNSEWKERGTGDVKILEHNITHKFRFIMRREQILKLCLNHAITSDLELKVMINAQGKAWAWMAEDFSEGEGSQEDFAVKFRSKEIADEFKAAFDRVKENASKSPDTSRDMTTNEAEDNGAGVKEGKPEVSSSMQNFSLEAEDTKSKSPETVKPEADAKSVITSTPKVFVPQLTGFTFGMASSTFNFTPNKPADKPMDLSPQSPGVNGYYSIKDIILKPLIHLEKVEVKTGEEDETIVYSQRAKLFRFVNSEWKERGTGDVKILEHNITHKFRFIMRREQILKLCLNHAITSDLELKVMINAQGKAWVWMAEDFSEGEGSQEVFAVKFRSKEIADEFKAAFDRVKENASKSPDTSRDMTTNEAEDNGVAVKEGKPEVSSSMQNFSLEAEDSESKSPAVSGFASLSPTSTSVSLFGTAEGTTFAGDQMNSTPTSRSDMSTEARPLSPHGRANSLLMTLLDQPSGADGEDDVMVSKEQLAPEDTEKAKQFQLPCNFYSYEDKPPCLGCIGCADEDAEVIFVKEEIPSKEKIALADKYRLPRSFYLYESHPQCRGCIGCDEQDLKEATADSIGLTSEEVTHSPSETKTEQTETNQEEIGSCGAEECEIVGTWAEKSPPETDDGERGARSSISVEQHSEVEEDGDVAHLFIKRVTMMYFDDNNWLTKGTGDLKVQYDEEVDGMRISMQTDEDKPVANHLICQEHTLRDDVENQLCEWRATDFSTDYPVRRTFRVQFSSASAVQEFWRIFNKGKKVAVDSYLTDFLEYEE